MVNSFLWDMFVIKGMSSESSHHEIYFDLSGDDLFINFKHHLNENSTFKQMIQVQTFQNKRITIDLLDNHNEIQFNAINLKKILKHI